MIKYSIGIDISKKDFHGCLSILDKKQQVKVIRSHCYTNNKVAFEALQPWISTNCKDKQLPVCITMEATGVFYYELRSLTCHNQSLKESRTMFTNQLEAIDHSMYPNKTVIKSLGKMKKAIDV